MRSTKTLVFFTLQYPYGKKSETFIENEIHYLAEAFDRVIIIPREKHDSEQRDLPNNVEVSNILLNRKPVGNHYKYILSSMERILATITIYGYSIFSDKDRNHYMSSGYFLYYLANALRDAELIEDYVTRSKLKDAVFYDYWFVNSTLSLAYLKAKGKLSNFYCRAHGFDVFNERWDSGSVPFRQYIVKQINYVFAISNYNKQYIKSKVNGYKDKVKVAYLGVRQHQQNSTFKKENDANDPFLIVSCANLFPFKQIERIPEILSLIPLQNQRVRWVHFGDGPNESKVLEASALLPQSISFDYKGHVSNNEVLEFYANNSVNLFLSLSLKEGLPVSMMEAQSFGVPIMAYGIFGIPEIVNPKTGILLHTDDSNTEIANKLSQLINKELVFEKMPIQSFFRDHFSAAHNFKAFTKEILQ